MYDTEFPLWRAVGYNTKYWFLYMCAYVHMCFTNTCISIPMYVYNCAHIEWPRWQTVGFHTRCSFLCTPQPSRVDGLAPCRWGHSVSYMYTCIYIHSNTHAHTHTYIATRILCGIRLSATVAILGVHICIHTLQYIYTY